MSWVVVLVVPVVVLAAVAEAWAAGCNVPSVRV